MAVRLLPLTALAIVMSGAVTSPEADASAAWPQGSHGQQGNGNTHNENGKRHKRYSAVKSPTIMRGTQQISISVSEKTYTQAAFCKKTPHACNISQKVQPFN
ncbi:hypothetical protein N5079_23180 [Planotetraspora sp. A-T 1434]|uniref:hypothetical protein n=1 Tax=Planotetraspora sp. A-T 1434 TaxID=2979219 RepID=UPI0021BE0A13|nr:hypothetical protein [Planotetraspora sp. A-T 1434]MCT9933116.1 hypothetical protein [Planotetraspora sp. A-T 1434]